MRFSTQLYTQQVSDVKDLQTKQEINQIYSALRNLADQLDKATGSLSPVKTDWSAQKFSSILGGNSYKIYVKAAVPIAYGQVVNFYNNAGVLNARLASAATTATRATGICNIPGGIASGDFGEFLCGPGICTGISGMTPGTAYYLSDTPGTISAAAGTNPQRLGIALDSTTLLIQSFNGYI